MKNLISTLLVALFVSNFAVASGNDDKKVSSVSKSLEVELKPITSNERNAVNLMVVNAEETVSINIKDANGNVLFRETVKDLDRFSKNFVLDNLENGEYTFEIITPSKYVSKQVTVKK